MDAILDIRNLLHCLEVLEDIGIRERNVDALQIEEVPDVVDGARRDHGNYAQLVAVVQVAGNFGAHAKVRALRQSSGQALSSNY